MSLFEELESLPSAKLIEALSIRIYEPPLSRARDSLQDIAEALRLPILVLDFDTAVEMQGILGFLENSTGLFLPETIDAFEKIGAVETASILRDIQKTLERHGVTPARLRSDFAETQPFQVTTFAELHGDLGTMSAEVEKEARRLYIYGKPDAREPVWRLLEAYVETHRAECHAEIARIAGE